MNSKTIYDWIVYNVPHYALGTIYETGQEIPEPSGAHIVYRIGDQEPLYFKNIDSDVVEDENEGTRRIARTTISGARVTVGVNVYNDSEGAARLRALAGSRYRQDVIDLLGGKIALFGASEIRNLQFLGDTKYKHRYQADFYFLVNFDPDMYDEGETFDTLETYDTTGKTDNDDLAIEASIAE
jgi:hypothetical protein